MKKKIKFNDVATVQTYTLSKHEKKSKIKYWKYIKWYSYKYGRYIRNDFQKYDEELKRRAIINSYRKNKLRALNRYKMLMQKT